jgi:hypothetical protein
MNTDDGLSLMQGDRGQCVRIDPHGSRVSGTSDRIIGGVVWKALDADITPGDRLNATFREASLPAWLDVTQNLETATRQTRA